MSSQRNLSLDGVRGIAILQVFVYHFLAVPARLSNSYFSRVLFSFTQFTWTGVDLFFVLSGFLIGGILISARDSERYFSTFYFRRACRILPIYVLIVGSMAVWMLSHSEAPAWLGRPMPWIAYVTFTQNFWMAHRSWESWNVFLAVTWSLAIEEQFYLLLPATIRLTPRRDLTKLVLGIILATPILRSVLLLTHHLPGTASYVLLYCRTDALMLGVLAALLVRNERCMREIRNRRWMLPAAFLLSTIPLFVMAWKHFGVGGTAMTTLGYSCFAVFYFLFLMNAVSFENGIVATVCRNRFLTWTGLLAYGLYLLHLGVFGAVTHLAFSSPPLYPSPKYFGAVALVTMMTFFLAWLSWILIESRFMQLGHSLSYGTTRAIGAASSIPMVSAHKSVAGVFP